MKSLYISDFCFYVLSRHHLEIMDFLHIFLPYFYRGANSTQAEISH